MGCTGAPTRRSCSAMTDMRIPIASPWLTSRDTGTCCAAILRVFCIRGWGGTAIGRTAVQLSVAVSRRERLAFFGSCSKAAGTYSWPANPSDTLEQSVHPPEPTMGRYIHGYSTVVLPTYVVRDLTVVYSSTGARSRNFLLVLTALPRNWKFQLCRGNSTPCKMEVAWNPEARAGFVERRSGPPDACG
jgi:hypothetical protein